MPSKPSYPDDAPVDPPAGEAATAAKAAKQSKEAGSSRTRTLVTGAAIGIGSAALVAALLYANRSRKDGKA
ncbi:MAG: hypothetical protein QOH47_865 [Sphingomonadales bacterium]|jgi:hypothetical protein|nr:hypothetical protein [Sphingomonadales bacterium]